MGAVLVKNADRMMTSANPVEEGIELVFADGCRGLVPFADVPEIMGLCDLASIEMPNLPRRSFSTLEARLLISHGTLRAITAMRPIGRG